MSHHRNVLPLLGCLISSKIDRPKYFNLRYFNYQIIFSGGIDPGGTTGFRFRNERARRLHRDCKKPRSGNEVFPENRKHRQQALIGSNDDLAPYHQSQNEPIDLRGGESVEWNAARGLAYLRSRGTKRARYSPYRDATAHRNDRGGRTRSQMPR